MQPWTLPLFLLAFSLHALSLREAEEMALANNPGVRAAEEFVDRARHGRMESISRWLPKLTVLSQAYKTQKPLKFLKLKTPSAFFTQVSLTQAVLSSELLHQIKIAGFMVTQAEQMLQAAKNDVLFETRMLYYLVALDHKKVDTAKEHVRLLTHLADRMQGFYDIGEATAYNVNQAKVAVSNVTDKYYETLRDLKGHQDDLVRVLGSDPGQNIDVSVADQIDVMQIADVARKVEEGEKIFQSGSGYSPILQERFTSLEERSMQRLFSDQELEKWAAAADETRPDILLAKTVVSIAKQQVEEKRGEYWPTLSILAGYGGGSTPYLDQPEDRFNKQLFQWAAGLSLNWTIFDGLGRESRIRKAKSEERAMKFDALKVLQNAHADVREQIYKMEKALSKYLTASANLKLSEETLRQANSQLEIGYATIFDYLVSVDGFVRAKTTLDEGRFELLTSYYGLLHACGRSE